MTHGSVAKSVRQSKELHPERFIELQIGAVMIALGAWGFDNRRD